MLRPVERVLSGLWIQLASDFRFCAAPQSRRSRLPVLNTEHRRAGYRTTYDVGGPRRLPIEAISKVR